VRHHRLASEGAVVVLTDVAAEPGEKVAAEIRVAGHEASYRHCDVSSAADWSALADEVLDRHGRLDVLHSNAFTVVVRAAQELDEGDWDRQLASA
jgi:NAD(P)-dependent dehydrogenase (short-subunit alcohol dehydrogenase family)